MRNNISFQKILVINAKYLGDLIVCTPALRALRRSFPGASVSILVREEYKNVLKGNPNIDEIISFDFSIKKIKGLQRIRTEFRFIKLLRHKKFDAVISLQAGDRYAEWSFLSGAKIRVAPKKQNLSFLVTNKVEVYEDTISYLDYYLKIVEGFGAARSGMETEFYLDENQDAHAQQFILKNTIKDENLLIGIHPGASEPSKIFPFPKFVKIIEKLLVDPKAKVILFVGPAEKKVINEMSNIFNERVIVADTSGNIQYFAALLSLCKLFIANDSGVRHVSAALKIPTITLFPEDKISCWKFYDEEMKQYFLVGKRNFNDTKNPFLDSIDIETVYQKAREILQQ